MSDSYPLYGSSYQPKSADVRMQMVMTSNDPARTVMEEISSMLLDADIQRWLAQQGSVPTTMIMPWLQELYARGKGEGYQTALTQGEPTP